MLPKGFPHSPDCKESAYSAGDPSSITRSGRSLGEGNDYPLQYAYLSCLENFMEFRGQRNLQFMGSQRVSMTEKLKLSLSMLPERAREQMGVGEDS